MADKIINVDAVRAAQIERQRVNSIDIMDAVFFGGGHVLSVSTEAREAFKFTGLNNVDFVATLKER